MPEGHQFTIGLDVDCRACCGHNALRAARPFCVTVCKKITTMVRRLGNIGSLKHEAGDSQVDECVQKIVDGKDDVTDVGAVSFKEGHEDDRGNDANDAGAQHDDWKCDAKDGDNF